MTDCGPALGKGQLRYLEVDAFGALEANLANKGLAAPIIPLELLAEEYAFAKATLEIQGTRYITEKGVEEDVRYALAYSNTLFAFACKLPGSIYVVVLSTALFDITYHAALLLCSCEPVVELFDLDRDRIILTPATAEAVPRDESGYPVVEPTPVANLDAIGLGAVAVMNILFHELAHITHGHFFRSAPKGLTPLEIYQTLEFDADCGAAEDTYRYLISGRAIPTPCAPFMKSGEHTRQLAVLASFMTHRYLQILDPTFDGWQGMRRHMPAENRWLFTVFGLGQLICINEGTPIETADLSYILAVVDASEAAFKLIEGERYQPIDKTKVIAENSTFLARQLERWEVILPVLEQAKLGTFKLAPVQKSVAAAS